MVLVLPRREEDRCSPQRQQGRRPLLALRAAAVSPRLLLASFPWCGREKMKGKKAQLARFKIGDWVSFPYPVEPVVAQIIEDRGPPGVRGRHYYRIRLDLTWAEPDMFDLPEEDLEAVPRPDNATIMKYLKEGGLTALLQTNLIRGQDDPKAWLSYT